MNRIIHVLIVFLLVFSFSCARKDGGGLFFWQVSPEQRLFNSAEQQYKDKSYDKALSLYHRYLTQYPANEHTPAARLKIGMIYVYLEQYEKAVAIFNRVQTLYPQSSYDLEAGVGRLAVYYKTGQYQQVISSAGGVLSSSLARAQQVRVNLIVGDSYLAVKSPLDAYHAYLSAFDAAKADEKDKVLARLKTAISLLEPSDLSNEFANLDGRAPAGYLLYQLGLNYMEAGFAGDAVTTLSSFVKNFPHHENVDQAEKFIKDLEASAVTDHHIIGCLLPMTGKYAKFGQQALEGIEFALSEFARTRGIYSIRILVKDTASDPVVAGERLNELSQSNVAAVIGPIATAEDVASQAQSLRIPMIALTQKPGITGSGDYVFRNFLTPDMQIKALVRYAAKTLHAKRFAILYPDESYGDVYMNMFWDEVMDDDGKVVGVEAYDPKTTDFGDSIKKLVGLYYDIPEDLLEEPSDRPMAFDGNCLPEKPVEPDVEDLLSPIPPGNWYDELTEEIMNNQLATAQREAEEEGPEPIVDFDAVFIPDSPNKAGLIIPQLAYYDVNNVYLLGTNLWYSEKLIDMANRYLRDAIMPVGFFDQSRSENVHRFVSGFKYIYGHTPGFIEADAYDTAGILFDLISRPEVRFRAQIKNALLAMSPFPGVTGSTVFDANGEAEKDIYLLKVSGRHFSEIKNKQSAGHVFFDN